MISFAGDTMRVLFDRFDLDAYAMFLKVKRLPESTTLFHPDTETYTIEAPARFAPMLGVEVPRIERADLPLSEFLFDDQAAIVRMALDAKRFACWSDCGLGKTLVGLEYARHIAHRTGGRVLVVTMNEVVPQWIAEAAQFYGDSLSVRRLHSRQEMIEWMRAGPESIAITNYEKWNPPSLEEQVVSEARLLAGIVLDESSRLKTGGGKQKWALIKSCRGIEYKLSLTATPAPNDTMEFASQASFLEKMRSEGEIIWTYFCRDSKTHRWTVKAHAKEQFFRFMAGWSIYVQDPRRFGWRLDAPRPPEPTLHVHEIKTTEEQRAFASKFTGEPNGQLSFVQTNDTNAIQRAKLSQAAKGFRYLKGQNGKAERIPSLKPAFVAQIVRQEAAAGLQVLVWCVFNEEARILADLLGEEQGVDVLGGDTKEDERLAILDRFRTGKSCVLVAKATMLGYGMNFQCCGSMVFSGFNDSYEAYYQAVRRAYRHGQKKSLRVHIAVVPELEGDMWENLCRKQDKHREAIREMELNYLKATREVRSA